MTYHEDESYYLVFAEAMHRGAVPYLDIWDRKPFGLFILYWLMSAFPGDDVLTYQAFAGLFTFATALTCYLIARRHTNASGACLAGVAYMAALPILLGSGGQTPVFYNLFIAVSVYLVLLSHSDASFRQVRCCAAMLLCGIAITIKPTAIVESVFLGMTAGFLVLRQTSARLSMRLALIGLLALLGALPTLAILGYFAGIGLFETYWFATVQSVGLKIPQAAGISRQAAIYLMVILLPLWGIGLTGAINMVRSGSEIQDRHILIGWLMSALLGFLLIPNFWDHYALPLIPPVAVLAASIFARPDTGKLWAGAVIMWVAVLSGWPSSSRMNLANNQIDKIVSVIDEERADGCFYLFEGPPILYARTNACFATSRLFPQHLSFALESTAIGVDTGDEMRRIIARRPSVIAMSSQPLVKPENRVSRNLLISGLNAYYHKVATLPVSESNRPVYYLELWAVNRPDTHMHALH